MGIDKTLQKSNLKTVEQFCGGSFPVIFIDCPEAHKQLEERLNNKEIGAVRLASG